VDPALLQKFIDADPGGAAGERERGAFLGTAGAAKKAVNRGSSSLELIRAGGW